MQRHPFVKRSLIYQAQGLSNRLTAAVIPFSLKLPALFDFYEGEWPLDWASLKNIDPFRLVFQATCGAHGRHSDNKPDRYVKAFVGISQTQGFKYGLYHLLVPGETQRQADFYCQTVDSLGGLGAMMPILDVEYSFFGRRSIAGKQWAGQVKLWLDMVEAHFHVKSLIYTSKYYWSYLNYFQIITGAKKPMLAPPPWTKDYPGWFAGYPWTPYVDANVTMPKTYQANGFIDWAAWQYNDAGRPRFPANDLNLVSPWFAALLEQNAI
jgi:hypothetical protein